MIMSDIFCGYDSVKYKEDTPSGTWDAPYLTGAPLKPAEPTPPPVTPDPPKDEPEKPTESEKGEFDSSEDFDKENKDDTGWIS
jgi:hypothetical protein